MEKAIVRQVQTPQNSRAAKPTAKTNIARLPKKLWDNYIEIARVRKSDRLCLVVAAGTREGYRCINIREFYYVKRDDMWKPGRDGIVIPIVAPLGKTRRPDPNKLPEIIYPLKELLQALIIAADTAMTMDLEDPDKAIWAKPKVRIRETEETE